LSPNFKTRPLDTVERPLLWDFTKIQQKILNIQWK